MVTTRSKPSARALAKSPTALAERDAPRSIDVDLIDANPANPRQVFDEAELQALADSMATISMMQPIYVESSGERFLLLAGERRWRAAKLAGWRTIPAYVVKVDRATAVLLMCDENLQRTGFNPIEVARAIKLMTTPADQGGAGLLVKQAAARFGRSDSWASQHLSLLRLPEAWAQRVGRGDLEFRQARELAAYAGRPDVLAAVELDHKRSPQAWATCEQFERRLGEIVARLDGLTAAPGPGVTRVKEDRREAEATIPLISRSGKIQPLEAFDTDQDLVGQIVGLIDQVTTLAELERVERALRERESKVAALARKSRQRA